MKGRKFLEAALVMSVATRLNRMLHFGGIDPSGSSARPSGCALLDSRLRVLHMSELATDRDIESFFEPFKSTLYAIGLDGPCALPRGLHLCCFDPKGRPCRHEQPAGIKGRVCERDLAKLGIGCFFTVKKAFAKRWIHRSITLTRRLTRRGYRVLEVYPYGAKCRLFGKKIPRKSTRAGHEYLFHRLKKLGISFPRRGPYSHHQLDAVLGAYTCYLHYHRKAEEIGDKREGKIVLPKQEDFA